MRKWIWNLFFLLKTYLVEQRQRGRFAGFSLYVSNTDVSLSDIKSSTPCYKDGPQLPPLNFTIKCTERGRYVIFYNERFDEVMYPTNYEVMSVFTELLEVIVQGVYLLRIIGNVYRYKWSVPKVLWEIVMIWKETSLTIYFLIL